MAFGKSLRLKDFDALMFWRRQPEWEQKDRDRSLRGKARVKARKAARTASKSSVSTVETYPTKEEK